MLMLATLLIRLLLNRWLHKQWQCLDYLSLVLILIYRTIIWSLINLVHTRLTPFRLHHRHHHNIRGAHLCLEPHLLWNRLTNTQTVETDPNLWLQWTPSLMMLTSPLICVCLFKCASLCVCVPSAIIVATVATSQPPESQTQCVQKYPDVFVVWCLSCMCDTITASDWVFFKNEASSWNEFKVKMEAGVECVFFPTVGGSSCGWICVSVWVLFYLSDTINALF